MSLNQGFIKKRGKERERHGNEKGERKEKKMDKRKSKIKMQTNTPSPCHSMIKSLHTFYS